MPRRQRVLIFTGRIPPRLWFKGLVRPRKRFRSFVCGELVDLVESWYVLEGRSDRIYRRFAFTGLADHRGTLYTSQRKQAEETGRMRNEEEGAEEETRMESEEERNGKKRRKERNVGKAAVIMDEKTRRGRVEASQGKSNTMEPSRESGPERRENETKRIESSYW